MTEYIHYKLEDKHFILLPKDEPRIFHEDSFYKFDMDSYVKHNTIGEVYTKDNECICKLDMFLFKYTKLDPESHGLIWTATTSDDTFRNLTIGRNTLYDSLSYIEQMIDYKHVKLTQDIIITIDPYIENVYLEYNLNGCLLLSKNKENDILSI